MAVALVLSVVGLPAAAAGAARPYVTASQEAPFQALVFTRTTGFRHDSIPAGVAALRALGQAHGFTVDATEDPGAFTPSNLARYAVVVFLSTTGDVLNTTQQAAFEGYIRSGGGFAGIHAASDTEYDWPFYGGLVGGYFDNHPEGTPSATVRVEDRRHPSTAHLPRTWSRTDEWYAFRGNPRGAVRVLATVDEASYAGGTMGADHPIAWCSSHQGGRSWYTAMGHTAESFAEPAFLRHLLGGVQTAAGVVPADCTPAPVDRGTFEITTLAKGAAKTGEPMALAVLPDRRVLHTARDGRVWLTAPDATTTLAGTLAVYTHDEEGLQGIAVDADFATNRWVYLYYAPAGEDAHNVLSRMRLVGDRLDLASEQRILQVPAERGLCCHVGGEIDFDAQGNLYLSTGDDTNAFASDGYTPVDERPGRAAYDAQRTSANTNDLRGKLLRIRVAADGSYTSPAGNLFPEAQDGDGKTRPEIYAMGFRNPFRFAVDRRTGWVLLGDFGPDAAAASPTRGPGGIVEFNLVTSAGNFGWPYCVGDQLSYNGHDFATGTSGEPYDCAAPRNTSPNNTGLVELPPAQPSWIAYDGGSVPEFGNGSESPMGGPTYDYAAAGESPTRFPASFDGVSFPYEFGRGWIKALTAGPDGRPSIEPFAGGGTAQSPVEAFDFKQIISVEFGPDGALYVLDYGSGFMAGDAFSAVHRIDYVRGGLPPVARVSADRISGPLPLTVTFDSAGSASPDGSPLTYAWDVDGDGVIDSRAARASHTYSRAGQYTARLTVGNGTGKTGSASVNVTAGNSAPVVTLTTPTPGGLYDSGDQIRWSVRVSDAEDGAGDCARVEVRTALGHNEHSHGDQIQVGCSGVLTVPPAWENSSQRTFYVLTASYTDSGGLTGTAEAVLHPRVHQGEHAVQSSGTQTVEHAGAAGGARTGYIDAGDWIRLPDLDLGAVTGVVARTSGLADSAVELRQGSPDGTLVATVPVRATGSWDLYTASGEAPVRATPGARALYARFPAPGMDLDELTLVRGESVRSGAVVGVGGMCVDVAGAGTADGTAVQLWTCNGTGAQHLTPGPADSLQVLGKCLDVKGAGTTDGTEVQLWTCNGSGAQNWRADAAGRLVNLGSGKCLDARERSSVPGTRLQIWSCHSGTNQLWRLP